MNKPVAWIEPDVIPLTHIIKAVVRREQDEQYSIPLYTHPVKELKNIVVASATCSCGKVMEVTNLQPVKELTDEEIKQIWYDLYPLSSSSYWDDKREGLAELKFAKAILRKAQEK